MPRNTFGTLRALRARETPVAGRGARKSKWSKNSHFETKYVNTLFHAYTPLPWNSLPPVKKLLLNLSLRIIFRDFEEGFATLDP